MEKCGKCNKASNGKLSASLKCTIYELFHHKKCTGLLTNGFSKIVSISKKQPHKWICNHCMNDDSCVSMYAKQQETVAHIYAMQLLQATLCVHQMLQYMS